MKTLPNADVKHYMLRQEDLGSTLARLPNLRKLDADLWLISDSIARQVGTRNERVALPKGTL